MIHKVKDQTKKIDGLNLKVIKQQRFEMQAKKYLIDLENLKIESKCYMEQIDKLKIALIDYDQHIRANVITNHEFMIQQLETENAHLRKMLKIPEELFLVDPEEEKKKEAERKKSVLRSIDEKLKQAEKKIAKKQTAAEIYYQQQKEQGFDPFELDQEDYDIYRMSKLKDQDQMPKQMKEQVHAKIYGRIEERNYREEYRRQHEKDILEEFARVYGYDVNKHQPHHNNGEIDVEYLQAYIAECRAKEEQMAKEQSLAKQKEALKGKVGAVSKKPAEEKKQEGMVKKNLTVETENMSTGPPQSNSSGNSSNTNLSDKLKDEKESSENKTGPSILDIVSKEDEEDDEEEEEDDFERSETPPMDKKQLEENSSNSVGNLQRDSGEGGLSMTLNKGQLTEMIQKQEEGPLNQSPGQSFVDDEEEEDEREEDSSPDSKNSDKSPEPKEKKIIEENKDELEDEREDLE